MFTCEFRPGNFGVILVVLLFLKTIERHDHYSPLSFCGAQYSDQIAVETKDTMLYLLTDIYART